MRRALEFTVFLSLAIGAHAAVWFGAGPAGQGAAGELGERRLSVEASSGAVQNLVATWDAPVQVATKAETAPQHVKRPQSPSVAPALQLIPQVYASAQNPSAPSLPSKPKVAALPQVSHDSSMSEILKRAPVVSHRPKARPSPPKKQAPVQHKQARNVKGEKAAGIGAGPVAGRSAAASNAAISDSKQRDLIRQWGAAIAARVAKRKFYPPGTSATGTAVVHISVSAGGKLLAVAIRSSSGNSLLDNAALRTVKRTRYPAAPRELAVQHYKFNLPVGFIPSKG